MSDHVSDGSSVYTSLPKVADQVQSPALSDISKRDKPWDKHKASAEKVTKHYSGSDYDRYARRVNLCADLLQFRLCPDSFEGVYKLKLKSARFCRVRHCPVCQWRRSLRWKAKAAEILPRVVEDYPNYRWLFVTFTVKNCEISELRETIGAINKGFKRMTLRKAWPAVGWIRSIEVTRNKKDDSAHPHVHTLLLVPSSYFSGRDYMSKKKWIELWQNCARLPYKPILDVQALNRDIPPTALIPEVLKYAVKESDLVRDREWLLELTHQLHKTLGVTVGGVLRDYFRNTDQEIEGDLIGQSDDSDIDEGYLLFGWKRQEKKYRMVEI